MYYDDCTYRRGEKTYRRELLRESFRRDGKVCKRTVANVTKWPEPVKQALRDALSRDSKHGTGMDRGTLAAALAEHGAAGPLRQGKSVGAVGTVLAAARRQGLDRALGSDRAGRLALFQVFARVLDQGSRLSAVRGARRHVGAELLNLDRFDEDDLYENLDWLCANQQGIEDRLFAASCEPGRGPALFLYDVTSSYFEGTRNELGAFGYNRDGKKGKRQVVAGLLTASDGLPLSIELFPGNTGDPTTVPGQIAKLRERFGGGEVRIAERTRAHALVMMLACRIVRELTECWSDPDQTVEEGLRELSELCVMEVALPNGTTLRETPTPRDSAAQLLRAAHVEVPAFIPPDSVEVDTERKLPSRRKSRQ